MDKKEYLSLVEKMGALYPGRIDTKLILNNWYEFFADCDYECILSCLNKYSKDNIYPPTIADLLVPYNEGIEKTNTEIRTQANRIRSSLSWLTVDADPETFVQKYFDIMEQTPIKKRYTIAKQLGETLWHYAISHEGATFDFDKWIKGVIND